MHEILTSVWFWIITMTVVGSVCALINIKKNKAEAGSKTGDNNKKNAEEEKYFGEGDLDWSKASQKPVCRFCDGKLEKIRYIITGPDIIYFCSLCGKILNIANNEKESDDND